MFHDLSSSISKIFQGANDKLNIQRSSIRRTSKKSIVPISLVADSRCLVLSMANSLNLLSGVLSKLSTSYTTTSIGFQGVSRSHTHITHKLLSNYYAGFPSDVYDCLQLPRTVDIMRLKLLNRISIDAIRNLKRQCLVFSPIRSNGISANDVLTNPPSCKILKS